MITLTLTLTLCLNTQVLEESRITTMLNEWERTCLPPQNEKVNKILA